MIPEVICTRHGCMKPITDPTEAREKNFLVVATGQVLSLRRHDACENYGDALRRIDNDELRKINSPAMAMKRMLEYRRAVGSRHHKALSDVMKAKRP